MISDIAAYVAFAAVVEEGSLAAAARRLGSSKTAVSRYVARLEALAGVKLVNRTSRKLGLTASGAELYESCRDILRTMSELDQMMRGMAGLPSGLLRVFAPPVLQIFESPHADRAVRRRPFGYPDRLQNRQSGSRSGEATVRCLFLRREHRAAKA